MVKHVPKKNEFIVEDEAGKESQRGIKNMMETEIKINKTVDYFFFYKFVENKKALKKFEDEADIWHNQTEKHLNKNIRILLQSLPSLDKTSFIVQNKNSANEIIAALENVQIMES